jgi:hypothetical protein
MRQHQGFALNGKCLFAIKNTEKEFPEYFSSQGLINTL